MTQNFYLKLTLILTLTMAFNITASGQATNEEEKIWQEPWEGVPEYYKQWDYPDFQFPEHASEWKDERVSVRQTLIELLGDIPARPEQLKVKTLFREERNGYILEKFVIDNEVDSWIPGYIAIPADAKGKVPVILGLHGHSSSKENILGSNSDTAQDVLALLISNGFAVMAIDSYFNGERRGLGPAGTNEMQERNSNQERPHR